ncbi:hypothetical protein [Conexibacter sp. CPCC 206217]|uniref:hypothetical protein n=1 Tax=Conexibacter sp. CPCC 206217 TaxID=3064574 RepID=UPI0027212CAC|nr:hypothetical protein [Conexibacter sp. CPCC 206217]MDO8214081.1 hypothetical protein [Conexibacter sp. CPCC 206217]
MLYGGGWWRGPPVLCRRTSPWQAKSGAELNANDYPAALHAAYFCCSLTPLERQPRWMEALDPAVLLPPRHVRDAPFSSSWLDVMLAVDAARLNPVRAARRARAASPRASV